MKKMLFAVAVLMFMLVSCEHVARIMELVDNEREDSSDNEALTLQAQSAQSVKPANPAVLGAYGYDGIPQAKAKALSTGRPLLLVASMDPCAHCDNFERLVLNTKEFANYVKESGLVVVNSRNNNLLLYTKQAYRTGYGAVFSGAPYVYLFRVKEGADCETVNRNSFTKDQVELLKSDSLGKYFVGSYKSGGTFMGIPNGEEKAWNPSTFIRQIKACLE